MTGMNERSQITRSAELETLAVFRAFVAEGCQRHSVEHDACHDIQLAVDEACTNVITHGYEGMNPGSIMLTCEFSPTQVTIEITDFGHPFEPYEPEKPVLAGDELSEGGFGLYFIYQTMDEIGYRSHEEGNTLTFVKRLTAG